MCREGNHTCYCGKVYECTLPNWVCPTINGDEDSSMCDTCMEAFEKSYNEFIDSGEGGDPPDIKTIDWKKS